MPDITSIQVLKEIHKKIKEYADSHGYKISGLTNAILRDFLEHPHEVKIQKEGEGMEVVRPRRIEQ